MALTYVQTADLMNDGAFRGRVKVACLHFADYIASEAANVPAHTTRLKWANSTFMQPDAAAAQVIPAVVMDPAVQDQGAAIDDPGLQTATENAVNKML